MKLINAKVTVSQEASVRKQNQRASVEIKKKKNNPIR